MDQKSIYSVIVWITTISCMMLVFAELVDTRDIYNVTLRLNRWTHVHLNSSAQAHALKIHNIKTNVTFLIIQAHSFGADVTLAVNLAPKFGEFVTSPDAGMTSLLTPGQDSVTWYLSTTSETNVTAYVMVTAHDEFDPVPGACNQEFPLEHDPNLHLNHDPNVGSVAYQFSNRGFPRLTAPSEEPDCESQWDLLTYDVYIHYMKSANPSAPEHFLAMQHMTHPEDIMKHGRKMVSLHRGKTTKPKSDFEAYPGQGIIYNVIVTQTEGQLIRQAAYIPSTSYSCSLKPDRPDSCDTLYDRSHPYKAITTIMACGGALLMLFGHKFLKCNFFTFGFLCVLLLSYIALHLTVSMDQMSVFWISLSLGVVGGVLWTLFWWYVGIPILSVLLVGLTAGYLMASVVFYTPFDSWDIFRVPFNYGMVFACWLLLFNVIVLPWAKTLSVLASCLVGSYSVVLAAGLYVKSSVPYILVNSVRKAVVPDFIHAIPTKPYFMTDTILLITWVVLFILSATFQFYSTRHDPDFPPCPRAERLQNQQRLILAEESADNGDRRGLLSQVSYPSYRATDAVDPGLVNPGYAGRNPNTGFQSLVPPGSGYRVSPIGQRGSISGRGSFSGRGSLSSQAATPSSRGSYSNSPSQGSPAGKMVKPAVSTNEIA